MFVTNISIRRDGYYGTGYGKADPAKPFRATIEVHGKQGKVELELDPAMSERIVGIIAEEVANAGRATAEAMVASVISAVPQITKAA